VFTPEARRRYDDVIRAEPNLSPLLSSPVDVDDDLLREAHGVAGGLDAEGGSLLDLRDRGGSGEDFLTRVIASPGGDSGGDLSASPLEKLHELSREYNNNNNATTTEEETAERRAFLDATTTKIEPASSPARAASFDGDRSKIRVVVRKRPMNRKEHELGQEDIVTMNRADRNRSGDAGTTGTTGTTGLGGRGIPGKVVVWEPRQKVDLTRYTERHEFAFDEVYPESSNNDEIYRDCVKPLVGSIFHRCKVTCFAYGQTGSGKTHTMSPLPIRAAGEILAYLARPENASLALHVSFFEIYGGKVYDLLNGRRKLVIREDARSQMCVVGLQEFEIADVDLVERLIEHGTAARCVGSTGANAESSRSHAILQLALKRRGGGSGGGSGGGVGSGGDASGAKNDAESIAREAAETLQMPPSVAARMAANEKVRSSITLVPVRPRTRGERRSLRTFLPGASLRPGSLAFNPRPRRLSTPLLTPFNSTPRRTTRAPPTRSRTGSFPSSTSPAASAARTRRITTVRRAWRARRSTSLCWR
jgi:kinesin family protein 2/24